MCLIKKRVSFLFVIIVGSVTQSVVNAQIETLIDAPKQIRFFANQCKANFEKVLTLKGELHCVFRQPVKSAIFYYDRGGQLGIGEITVAGDFIKEDSETYTFTWDLASDSLVSIGAPSDKPCRYLEAEKGTEVVPENRNSIFGTEEQSVISTNSKISTSNGDRTADGEHQVYVETQDNRHEMRGSPKSVFYWQWDFTYHEFLFVVAQQIQDEREAAGVCHLKVEGDMHTLGLTANSKSGQPLTYKWVFDASRNFALTLYECFVGEVSTVTTHQWTYSMAELNSPIPVRLITTIASPEITREEIFELSKMVVNEPLAEDTFSLSALKPSNGDFLLKKETGEMLQIFDQGNRLVDPTAASISMTSSRFSRIMWINAVVIALVVVVAAFRKFRPSKVSAHRHRS